MMHLNPVVTLTVTTDSLMYGRSQPTHFAFQNQLLSVDVIPAGPPGDAPQPSGDPHGHHRQPHMHPAGRLDVHRAQVWAALDSHAAAQVSPGSGLGVWSGFRVQGSRVYGYAACMSLKKPDTLPGV